jgi:hypothetical protein
MNKVLTEVTFCNSMEDGIVSGFDPSILRHNGILGAADGAVLNNVHKKGKNSKKSRF